MGDLSKHTEIKFTKQKIGRTFTIYDKQTLQTHFRLVKQIPFKSQLKQIKLIQIPNTKRLKKRLRDGFFLLLRIFNSCFTKQLPYLLAKVLSKHNFWPTLNFKSLYSDT